jgi:hypothetical protein
MTSNRSKMRILSFHHIQNNGAFLFVFSLLKLLRQEFNGLDIKIIDYKSNRLAIREYLKRFNIFQRIPQFYLKRARMWDEQIKMYLDLDQDFSHFSGEKALQEFFCPQI